MNESNDTSNTECIPFDSAWERWELPFFDSLTNINLSGRTVSSVLNELLQNTSADVDAVSTQEEPHFELNELDQPKASVESESKNAFQLAYQDGMEKGLKDGFDQGYAEGLLKAKQVEDAELLNKKLVLSSLMEELQNHTIVSENNLINKLTEILHHMLKLLLPSIIESSPDHLVELIKKAIAPLDCEGDLLTINLHPVDCDILKKVSDMIPDNVRIKSDETRARGVVWVESRYGFSEFNFNEHIDQLFNNLKCELIPKIVKIPNKIEDNTVRHNMQDGQQADA